MMSYTQRLIDWLTKIDTERQHNRGWAYKTHEGLTLAHGRWFETVPTRANGTPRNCYREAWKYATRYRNKGVVYCEGYFVLENGLVSNHAWTMRADGMAIDPSYKGGMQVMGIFGIPFTREFCLSRQSLHSKAGRKGYIALFDNDHLTGYSLLKEGLPPDAIAAYPQLQTG